MFNVSFILFCYNAITLARDLWPILLTDFLDLILKHLLDVNMLKMSAETGANYVFWNVVRENTFADRCKHIFIDFSKNKLQVQDTWRTVPPQQEVIKPKQTQNKYFILHI